MVLKDAANAVKALCKGINPTASFLGILYVERFFKKGGVAMKVKVFKMSSFTESISGGNPAGVVMEGLLSESQMKKTAAVVNCSETAFVSESDEADFKVRFFTPVSEVDLCGHATIATFALMFLKKKLQAGKYSQQTKAGVLGIEIQPDGQIMMEQALPQFGEEIDKDEVAKVFGIDKKAFSDELPIQVVSTGLRDIIVPVRSFSILNGLKPDFEKVGVLAVKHNSAGFHFFTRDRKGFDASCRNFAPHLGINEEPATGTASGALGCYLVRKGICSSGHVMVFEQGYSMEKPSAVKAVVSESNGVITKVQVGGKAVFLEQVEVEI